MRDGLMTSKTRSVRGFSVSFSFQFAPIKNSLGPAISLCGSIIVAMERSDPHLAYYLTGAAAGLIAAYALYTYMHSNPSPATPLSQGNSRQKPHISGANSDSAIETAIELMSESPDDGWETIKSTPSLSIYRKKTGDSPVAIIKANVRMTGVTVEDVMKVIWNVEIRVTWDSVMKGFRDIEKMGEDKGVIYFYVKPPVPFIAARDFVQLRCREKVGEDWIIAYKSVERPDCELPEGYIRGETRISGYRIGQRGEECEVDFISQTDIKGSIPVGLLNTIAPLRAQEWIKKMTLAAQSLQSSR